MPRINPRLDPHELADLMAAPRALGLTRPSSPASGRMAGSRHMGQTRAQRPLDSRSATRATDGHTPQTKTPRHPADPMGGKEARSGRIK